MEEVHCLGQTMINMCQDSVCDDNADVVPMLVFPNKEQLLRYLKLAKYAMTAPKSPLPYKKMLEFSFDDKDDPYGMWMCLVYATFLENNAVIDILVEWLLPYVNRWSAHDIVQTFGTRPDFDVDQMAVMCDETETILAGLNEYARVSPQYMS